ncbi:polymer-forming cytoskeletal protein [Acinetobacter ursingii]|uniref:polymer-forming cytoskeletal protein n=1 Tax=Acinetobacter ursingii TaxID=108980 RepID=UPI00124E9C4C|nr:polymer-forming cytoskeletal protein [Acinetobacter ursingii]
MENKKYELLDNDTVTTWDGRTLKRIRALVAIGSLVAAGELGGYIESEDNLSQVSGNAWVSGNAQVYGNARVYGNAQVSGNAWVSGNARVSGNAWVSGDARVYGNAQVSGNAQVYGNAWVSGDARVEQRRDIFWMSIIGSENGTYTAFKNKDGGVSVNRGCFNGTLEQFVDAVNERHTGQFHQEYQLVIELTKIRLGVIEEAV